MNKIHVMINRKINILQTETLAMEFALKTCILYPFSNSKVFNIVATVRWKEVRHLANTIRQRRFPFCVNSSPLSEMAFTTRQKNPDRQNKTKIPNKKMAASHNGRTSQHKVKAYFVYIYKKTYIFLLLWFPPFIMAEVFVIQLSRRHTTPPCGDRRRETTFDFTSFFSFHLSSSLLAQTRLQWNLYLRTSWGRGCILIKSLRHFFSISFF